MANSNLPKMMTIRQIASTGILRKTYRVREIFTNGIKTTVFISSKLLLNKKLNYTSMTQRGIETA